MSLRMLVVFLLAVAAAGEEVEKERVTGSAYGTPGVRPPVTNDPTSDFIDEDFAYETDDGISSMGTYAYELKQGAEHEDKARWAKTDYIAWSQNGATLKAVGQVHDKHADKATSASSDSWGAERVPVTVEVSEGKYAWIGADNQISFEYRYTISGDTIGEASVQLQGSAYDIKGKTHKFNLSDQRAVGTGSEESRKKGFEEKEYANLRVHLSNRPKGVAAGVSGELGAEQTTYEELEAKTSRRYATAGGDNDSTPTVVVRRGVSGPTPLTEEFSVFSDASVVLRARAGKVPGQAEAAMVVVELKSFRVENSLRVYKAAHDSEFPEPQFDPLPPPWSSPPGPSTPPDTGGAGTADGGEEGDDEQSDGNADAGTTLRLVDPHGLDGEVGSLPGAVLVSLAAPAKSDRVYDVVTDSGADTAGRIVVPVGRRHAAIPLLALQPGVVGVALRNASGDEVATATFVAQSTADHAEPRLWTGGPSNVGRGLTLAGLSGTTRTLAIGRLGFAGLCEEETAIDISVEDPLGVIAALATPQVVVAAGETSVDLTLSIQAAGVARIRFTHGDQMALVSVVGREQAWHSIERLRVPLGAVAPLPLVLRWPEPAARAVDGLVAAPSVACIDEADTRTELKAGESAWFFRIKGVSLGTTIATLSSGGLPALTVVVEVVPPGVTLQSGALRLSLPTTAAGTLELWVSDDACIAELQLPPGMTAEGLGTSRVVLAFEADPDRPAQILLPMRVDGDADELGVLERWREDADLTGYHLELR